MDASVRQFCASANARLQACTDIDAKRQFLEGHVERVIFNRYKVTGFVPVQSASGETKLQFRIKGEIDKAAVRANAQRRTQEKRLLSGAPVPDGHALGHVVISHNETAV